MAVRATAALVLFAALFSSADARPVHAKGYPKGADVGYLTKDGSAVGPLEGHRVRDKYTVFDVYADWCGPCRDVDSYLRDLLAQRADIAVRKLNIVSMDSPLAQELGPDFEAIPYLVVFGPDGKRTDIVGADDEALDEALGVR